MKSRLINDGEEKTFVLVFESGEEVTEGLLRFAGEQGLAGAHFTAIGALERVTLGFFESERKDYRKIPIHEQVELLSLAGNIARDTAGNPKVHAHAVVGKSDGTAHGGHLLDAHVRPTLEVVIVESPAHLCRRMRPDLGVALLDLSPAP
jgi:predicted DNA-binding protein with PD1-like motif